MRVLIASPVRQRPRILAAFLDALGHLDPDGHEVRFCFIDDNDDPEASRLLRAWAAEGDRGDVVVPVGLPTQTYSRDEKTHYWDPGLARRLALMRNHLLSRTRDGYDAILLLDSDLVLQPTTLHWLADAGQDIVSEVFWTEFAPDTPKAPNVWLWGDYGNYRVFPHEQVSPQEAERRMHAWWRELKTPGVHKVGGLGACTWISRRVIESGVSYDPIYNLGWWGEDRFFCIRAAVAGFELFADTHAPPLHLYRESDLRRLGPWRANTARARRRLVTA